MKCQATKSRWIREARDSGSAAIILYVNADEVCYCLQVTNASNLSRKHDWLIEEGYTVIEEILIK